VLFYIATLSPVEFWDAFGIFLLYIFTPSLLLTLTVIMKDLMKILRERTHLSIKKMFILSSLLFISLTSLLQVAIYPSGGSLTLVEFKSYGRYYYYKKELTLFVMHIPAGMNVEVLDDSILAQNIVLFSKIGSLPSLRIFIGYLSPDFKTYIINCFQTEGNIVYNCAEYQIVLKDKIILYKL
jgi:hypothetical protein